jgi:choline dehydrogenase-like flavoprotein
MNGEMRDERASAWLSRGFEQWLCERDDAPYDVLIVGSGYGGAVAAAELAGCTVGEDGARRAIRVCVLERGREYLPGMFPVRLAELPRHVRFCTERSGAARGTREGLFDVRVGRDVNAVLANGLGGGSLINAGVMAEPDAAVFERWRAGLAGELQPYLREARQRLGAEGQTIDLHRQGRPAKLAALEQLAGAAGEGARFAPASISVGMRDEPHGVEHECKRCGDCATGCNYGAKRSLDTNLLAQAWRAGAEIYTGATVLRLERDGELWVAQTVHTDAQLRRRQPAPARLRAHRVILAAGTFGSTEILLRSQAPALRFSPELGRRFSSNGDAIAVLYGQDREVDAVADESVAVADRRVGPTITGILDLRRKNGMVIEEIAIPGALRRVFEEVVTTVNTLHSLVDPDETAHEAGAPAQDPCAVDASAIGRTSVFVMMGDDGAEGVLRLGAGKGEPAGEGDGALRVHWPGLRKRRLFAEQLAELRSLARQARTGGRLLPNPLWQLLPDSMKYLFDERLGPLVTVHPLGGCAIGATRADGVVNENGQVFDASQPAADAAWGTLAVLDGSIVRSSLGINPALTIAALALRAVRGLRAQWGFAARAGTPAPPGERPRFRLMAPPATPRPTEVKLVERMSGPALLKTGDGGEKECIVELTLRFRRTPLAELVRPVAGRPVAMERRLEIARGELRVFDRELWTARRRAGEDCRDDEAELRAPLEGALSLFAREPSSGEERRRRARGAWLLNRGLRDCYQWILERLEKRDVGLGEFFTEVGERWRLSSALASHAGEARLLVYRLRLGAASAFAPASRLARDAFAAGTAVVGRKRFTYERRANPWRQLMELELGEFPALAGAPARLELDLKFLAAERVPLFRIVRQQDQVAALADVASFLAYMLRLLMTIHVWSFRKPDAPKPREVQRLPGAIPGRLPPPAYAWLHFAARDGRPVSARLTRYRPARAAGPPVLMIHGYSASGTTFAHRAVRPNMAEYFAARARDVWVLDMRTSSGLPTARLPWSFEEAALEDIPAAVGEVCRRSGAEAIDVFAHCMGSAMLGMAVLAPPPAGEDRFGRGALPARIRKAALSQIAPVVVFSPANVFRGYAMSYLKRFLPFENYQFRVRAHPGLADQLIDRLLATLPYPRQEFDIENPVWPWRRTPFVGTRHRMDALYGRDFNLADDEGEQLLDDGVLESIDDLFGPLSIETVSQAIHFARAQVITNRIGRNDYVLRRNLGRWRFPTLSIHGGENGLSDVATLARFERTFQEEAGIQIRIREFPGFGHQDSLIGNRAGQVFAEVFQFLQ